MVQIISRNLVLSLAKLLVLSVGIFLILRSAAYYDADFSFLEFCRSMVSGRLLDHFAVSGLPPLHTSVPYSLTTLLLALLLSYGVGAPLGVLLGRYRMAWTQFLGHVFMGVALAVPAFWIAYLVLYYSIMEYGVFIGGEIAPAATNQFGSYISRCLLLAVPLSLSGIAFVARQVFQTLFNAFPPGSILAARATGISQRMMFDSVGIAVVWRPLLRTFPFLLSLFISVLVVIETAFFVPGFGYSLYRAAEQSDLQSLAVLSLWAIMVLLAANLVVDVMLELIDARHPANPDPE